MSTWTAHRIKHCIASVRNGTWGEEPRSEGTDSRCIRAADFDRLRFVAGPERAPYRHIEPSELQKHLLREGDLILEKSGGGETQPVGAVVMYPGGEPAVCSNFAARLRTADGCDPRHVTYLFAHLYSVGTNIRHIKQSTGIQNLDAVSYLTERLPIPARLECQKAIADFLDRETERIDALVAKKQRLVELLREKRTALISHAVTKGLDPAVPMKDSGIEWLGAIPAHWNAGVIRRAATLESGHTPSRQHPEYWEDCSIPWFTLADIWQVRPGIQEYVSETSECVSEVGLAHSSARLLPTGTVLLSRTASVGFSAIAERPMATSQDFANWVCGDSLLPEYLLYVYRSIRHELLRLTMGSTHKTIYMPIIAKLAGPFPPVREQEQIVRHIRHETRQIDALCQRVSHAIERLREYRAALITAAVTGQIDVGGR